MTRVSLPPGLAAPPMASPQEPAMAPVLNPSAALARLAAGTIIVGTVLGRETPGQVAIRTDLGILLLALGGALPPGSVVSLELRTIGSRLHAIVLAVKPPAGTAGEPPALATPPPGSAATTRPGAVGTGGAQAPTAPPPALAGAPPAVLAAPALARAGPPGRGSIIAAVVVQPSLLLQLGRQHGVPAAANTAPTAAAASGGMATAPPPEGAAPPGGAIAALTPEEPPPTARTGAPAVAGVGNPAELVPAMRAAASAVRAPLPPGITLALRIVEILPPEPVGQTPAPMPSPLPPSLPSSLATASLLIGRVAATTPTGNPVVATPRGVLTLDVKSALPVGSRVVMELPQAPQPTAPGPAASAPWPDLVSARDWPALAEAVALLHGKDGPATATVTASAGPAALPLPQVGPRLAAGLLNLLAAFGRGDLAGWLGGTLTEPLDRLGHGDLLNRVRHEVAQTSHAAAQTASGDWRLLPLPLMDGSALHRARLYLRRRPGDGEASGRREMGTRFVLEVELSRLGALQLDGLVQARRFDLMLRSRAPLTPTMRRDIVDIFDEARAVGGFAGRVEFAVASTLPTVPIGHGREGRRDGGDIVV